MRYFLAKWISGSRTKVAPTAGDCLRTLRRMHPRFIQSLDSVEWAQRCMQQARFVIKERSWHGAVSLGDEQAISAYEKGVAIGFYHLNDRTLSPFPYAVPGSEWSDDQLDDLWRMGKKHGRWISVVAYGYESSEASPPIVEVDAG